jgi:hypothetical protein
MKDGVGEVVNDEIRSGQSYDEAHFSTSRCLFQQCPMSEFCDDIIFYMFCLKCLNWK